MINRDSKRWRAAVVVLVATCGAMTQAQQPESSGPRTLTLDQALQYGLDHYPAARAALEHVNASTAGVDVARATYLPRFDSFWQINRATTNNIFGQLLPQPVMPPISGPVLPSTSGQSVWGSAIGGLLSWEPIDFGLRQASVREAEAGVVRARAEQQLTQMAVQQAVGSAFLNAVAARQSAEAAAADVERREILARAARTLADNQLRPGAEASRAEAELAAARTRVIQTRQALVMAESTLSQVLGVADGGVQISAAHLIETVPLDAPASAPVSIHPAVQSGQASIDFARAREAVLETTYRPRLYLQSSVSARGSGANPDGVFDGGADGLGFERANWAAGMQIVFPNLFDLSGVRARRAAAGALTRVERARFDQAVLTVTSEQRTADALVDAARAIARNTPVQLAAAQQSEAQARARYEAGLASIVEVAETQNLLTLAEHQNAVARVDVWRALLAQAVAHGSLSPFIELVRAAGAP